MVAITWFRDGTARSPARPTGRIQSASVKLMVAETEAPVPPTTHRVLVALIIACLAWLFAYWQITYVAPRGIAAYDFTWGWRAARYKGRMRRRPKS